MIILAVMGLDLTLIRGGGDMSNLTKKEKAWIGELQAVLNKCPSPEKIGFYTIGDHSIMLYDLRRVHEVIKELDNRNSGDWCRAVSIINAGFEETIYFPSPVESTAG